MSSMGPFHEGELEAQRRSGESEDAARNSPMIGDRIMSGAVGFLHEQSMAVVGSRDADGHLWTSMIFGRPGFLNVGADRRSLSIRLQIELQDAGDPLWRNIERDAQIGVLIIDLATRRRLRVNGRVSSLEAGMLSLHVDESFANCPKYIQRREIEIGAEHAPAERRMSESEASELGRGEQELVLDADTLFVASAHPVRGLDTSHRGGNPGFIEVLDKRTLRVPDYPGNSMFNTIGNLLVDPKAGLLIPDFERGKLLQMTGQVEVEWGNPRQDGHDGGTGRSWIFHLEKVRRADLSSAVHTHLVDYSPYNPSFSSPQRG